jgi:transcriptional regulator with XRE-family HTH domain
MAADPRPLLAALGAGVRELRIARGLTQEEVAHRSGMHVTYLSGIERGTRNVSILNLDRLAAGLGITLAALMIALDEHRHS